MEHTEKPRNVPGSLVMDFGNTATSFIFAAQGEPPLNAHPIELINPFDPVEATAERRSPQEKQIFRSTAVLLRIQDHPTTKPWLLLGKRAEEIIPKIDPFVMSLWAPKKYVRDWPEHLQSEGQSTSVRGVVGQRTGLVDNLHFVRWALEQMLTLAISSQVNPKFASEKPLCYPQIKEILLTYPFTWRREEKELFQTMIRNAAEELLVLPEPVRKQFQVHLLCSEPVAVAAHVLWEVFFQFFHLAPGGKNLLKPSLVSSLLGNIEGSQELRLLVVDIGGGSTDVALVESKWLISNATADESGLEVDVHFQVLESLRFNRAGDRLSHLIATAILEYMRRKTGVREPLDFDVPAANPAFTRQMKREIVWQISRLVEDVKAHFVAHSDKPWLLKKEDESQLSGYLDLAIVADANAPKSPDDPLKPADNSRLELRLDSLVQWVREDRQSMRTKGEPGLMDIFYDLKDLGVSLRATGQLPHLVVLSGRTTRLPFFKTMVMEALNLPAHRVRPVGELLPTEFRGPHHDNIDKLSVVFGAHRLKFGHPIRFIPHPEAPVFRRNIGLVQQTPQGMRLSPVLVRSGSATNQTRKVPLIPGAVLLIGHAFREDSNRAEVIASIENTNSVARDVEITLVDDYHVELTVKVPGVRILERVSGGDNIIVDNFNDTGKIDREPDGLLQSIVLCNVHDWIKGGP